jgi:ribonuclease E
LPRKKAEPTPTQPAAPLVPSLIFQAPDLPVTEAAKPAKRGKSSGPSSRAAKPEEAPEKQVATKSKRAKPAEGEPTKDANPKSRSSRRSADSASGSTRVEARRQRRRDSRDTGRRRGGLTESEFLARRESVDRKLIVREHQDRVQIGVLEDGLLVEHYVAESQGGSLIGNVYLGKVQNVLPSMEAAFVDIGRGRNAVLYSGEVDWEAAENQPRRIELALKTGDTVLVQVTKDAVGQKGARLTSQISLPGRYLVYVPNGGMSGISRKLPEGERQRLKQILKGVIDEDAGVIVRTASEGASEEQLLRDVERLKQQWEAIQSTAKGKAPALLHSEPDLLVKIIRDVFNEDFQSLVVSGAESLRVIREYLEGVAPDLLDRLVQYGDSEDIFDHYRIGDQISKALDRKVFLPSGGSLVIDRTEAMTVVDVNTGKFVGSGGNLEQTVTRNNLEAAEELVRQLRLRDIGGIVVIDFIDMVQEANQESVRRRLLECLSRDRTKNQVSEITSLGLVQMTRKKIGVGLLESFSEVCECCAGRGVVVSEEPKFRMPEPAAKKPKRGKSEVPEKKVVTPEQASAFKSALEIMTASQPAAPKTRKPRRASSKATKSEPQAEGESVD